MEARRLPEASVGLEGGVRPVRQPLRGLEAAVAQTLGKVGAMDAAPTTTRTGQGHPLQTVGRVRLRLRFRLRPLP